MKNMCAFNFHRYPQILCIITVMNSGGNKIMKNYMQVSKPILDSSVSHSYLNSVLFSLRETSFCGFSYHYLLLSHCD